MFAINVASTQDPQQIPDVGKLTEGLPPWAVVLVIVSLAIMAVAIAAPKVLPLFKDDDKKKDAAPMTAINPPTDSVVVPAATALATAADASNELITRIISRLEDRLDAANTEIKEIREAYEARIGRLQNDIAERDRLIYELRSKVTDVERNMAAARDEAGRLRWQLEERQRQRGSGSAW